MPLFVRFHPQITNIFHSCWATNFGWNVEKTSCPSVIIFTAPVMLRSTKTSDSECVRLTLEQRWTPLSVWLLHCLTWELRKYRSVTHDLKVKMLNVEWLLTLAAVFRDTLALEIWMLYNVQQEWSQLWSRSYLFTSRQQRHLDVDHRCSAPSPRRKVTSLCPCGFVLCVAVWERSDWDSWRTQNVDEAADLRYVRK